MKAIEHWIVADELLTYAEAIEANDGLSPQAAALTARAQAHATLAMAGFALSGPQIKESDTHQITRSIVGKARTMNEVAKAHADLQRHLH